MNTPSFRGDPFYSPADTAPSWEKRIGWLQARAYRPNVWVRGEDLAMILGLLRATSRQAYLAEAHCDRLRAEVARLEAEAEPPHSPIWEAEPEAA